MKLSDLTKFLKDIETGTVRGHENDRKLHDAVCRLASLGWALPANLSIDKIERLAGADYTDEAIHNLLMEFYSRDECSRLEAMVSDASLSEDMEFYTQLLDEALKSYRDERYRICVPALLTVVEGLLTEKLGIRNTTQLKLMAPTKEKIDEVEMNLTKTFWTSVHTLISSLFKQSKFDEKMPKELNRNWILHGRASLGESKKDALQLFVLIATINAA